MKNAPLFTKQSQQRGVGSKCKQASVWYVFRTCMVHDKRGITREKVCNCL